MGLTTRFSVIDKAILTSTGNSLVSCGSTTATNINTSDMIKSDGTPTRDYTQAGSTASLNILENSTILYAELVWYSTVKSNVSGSTDLRSIQDNDITLITPNGTYQIIPQYTESYTGASGTVDRFRAKDVTSIISQSLGGNYTVSNVPISVPEIGLSNSRAGWSLSVVYRNDTFRPQKIIYMSGISVATEQTPLQVTVAGFTTDSDQASLKGSTLLVCANGNPLAGNEFVSAGQSFASLVNIGNTVYSPNPNPGTSPNNPGNRFFSGTINVADPLNSNNGVLNINGTNGTLNNDGFVPTQTLGGRNKWDITNVDITKALVPNQTLLAGQITESGTTDGVQLVVSGTQVNSQGPDMNANLSIYNVDGESAVVVGEKLVYVVNIKNDGSREVNNVMLSMPLDSNTTFLPDSVNVNGIVQIGANIATGVNIGTIAAKGSTRVIFTIIPTSLPADDHLLKSIVSYSYQFTEGPQIITNYDKTNQVQIGVEDAKLSVVQISSATTVVIGDSITYTVNINNTGSQLATNMFFQNNSNPEVSFVSGSIKIDGITHADLDPSVGFILPDLPVGRNTQVVFENTINSLPPSTIIKNTVAVSFEYRFTNYLFSREKTVFSNTTSIQIQYVDIIGKRCNNNSYPKVGDTITYTLSITNMGNITASNVQVLEPPIIGATFVSGSVKLNGGIQPDLNPFEGFMLPQGIGPKQTTTVDYNVLINQIDPSNVIENIAQVPFKYEIIPGGTITESKKDSNKVETVANYVCMKMVETVDKSYAHAGYTLYYKIILSNSGNVNATNNVFTSNIQPDTTFIPNSVTINGISYPGYDPNQGFSVGTICADDSVEIYFSVNVVNTPNPNIVYNQSQLVYNYKPNPNESNLKDSIFSNTVQTIINEAKYTITKSVDKAYAQVGDIIIYTNLIQNTGTIPLTNVSFADEIATYSSFYPGSVYVNGIPHTDYDPDSGFSLDDLHPGDTARIVFAVTVDSVPPFGYIANTSEATFSYRLTPSDYIITKTVFSNEVKTYISYGNLNINKIVDKSYATIGDILTYSFTVSNTGNVPINNPLFTDIIQSQASFISGSVMVNGITKPTYDPSVGFTLGTINVGQVVTISFKVNVNSLPNLNVINNSAAVSFSYHNDPNAQPITKNVTSNTVTTTINTYSANLTKAVNKSYATIGDILNYTVIVHNTGSVYLRNVNLLDMIPDGATFVVDSVMVDGVSKPGFDPNTGFVINDVNPDGNVVVMFKATVTSVPTPPQINNTSNVSFKYRLNPTSAYTDESITSNTVTTSINKAVVTNTKAVDKIYATVGNTLTYTSVIRNTGNIDITNTDFIDIVPNYTTFEDGSVKIDNTEYLDYDPNIGFTLGTITPGSAVSVTFKVNVDSLPSNGYLTNVSTINYQYKINPDGSPISSSVISNTVTTYINVGNLSVTKVADRTIVRLTNIITYNFVIANTGNITLKDLSFIDTIQVESSFNTGSVYVNGISKPSYNPNNGFSLGDIPVGQQTIVNFTVTVDSLPKDNKLLNKADVTFSYYVDPKGTSTTKTTASNTTTVYVYDTIVSANKSVDKSIAKIGDILNFTIDISNEGNVAAQTVLFKDILDSNIAFVTDSVYVNGIQKKGYNPKKGFSLDDVLPNETTTVTFEATVVTRPANNIIYNFATIDYEYTINTDIITANINTNTTTTFVATGELTLAKSVNKTYATVGDDLSYTIVVKNTGSVNATRLSFKDLISSSTSFNVGSVVVDGTQEQAFDPNIGFDLTDLEPNQYHTVTFSIHIDSLPVNGKVENTADATFTYKLTSSDAPVTITATSNKVTTLIELAKLVLTKAVDKAYTTIGNTLSYTVTINNQGNTNCFNVFFQDIIQSDAAFVSGSVKIDGATQTNYNPNKGFNLSDIPGYGSITVSFDTTVSKLPTDNTIYNYATTNYSYYIDPANHPIVTEAISNMVSTIINVGSLTAIKAVSKSYATIGDSVSYTVNIRNNGNIIDKNVNFRDVIPSGLTFVTNSVTINEVPYPEYNPYNSFSLGNIIAGDTLIVKFDAIVTSLPTPSLISNTAQLTFVYRIDPNGSDIIKEINSNIATTQINLGLISLNKNVDKAYATMGDVLTYTVVVANDGNVDAENVNFADNLQSDIIFNTGSVIIEGKPYTDYDPNIGFSLGTIQTLSSVTVSFKATVISQPTQSTVLNFAVGTFSYKIDPNGKYYSKSVQSNTVNTTIIKPSLTATKVVDKVYATIQNLLNYSILVKNSGNTTVSQLFFSDILSNGAIFSNGTVVIDGVSYPTYDPIAGFELGNLLAGNTSLVQFQAIVNAVPTPPQVTNYATLNGLYKVNPQGIDYPIAATSNTVTTNIKVGSLSNVKDVDKMYAKVNDTITYTSTITNTGNVNISNIQFTDALQSALSYVLGTVRINNVVYPVLDPTVGFVLSDLAPGQAVAVAFNVKINVLPIPPYVTNTSQANFSYKIDPNGSEMTKTKLSNTVRTDVVLGKINTVKTVDKPIATIGDTLTYTVTLTNVGNIIDTDVLFQDTPSTGAVFKEGTVKINGVTKPTFNPTVGFSIGDVGIGNVVIVEFIAEVVSVPPTNKVTNQAVIAFKYLVDPKQPPYSDTTYSNTVTTNIGLGSLSVTKSVNKEYATIGENLTYTIVIINTGNIDATNVEFLDLTPHNAVFVLGSVTINGVSYPTYNPSTGFNLDTMVPSQIITVVYQVQVVDLC